MAEVSSLSLQTHLEKSSTNPSIIETVNTPKTLQTHFGKSSLASCSIEVPAISKPQIPSSFPSSKSYQILLVEHAMKLEKLQGRLVQFDTQQIEKAGDKIKKLFSERLEVNALIRERQIHAGKWQTTTTVIAIAMLLSSFYITFSFKGFGIFASIAKSIPVTCTSQKILNDAHLSKLYAKKTCLDHEFKKGTIQQSRLAQNSGDSAFNALEEQIHLLAIALDKQAMNF